MLLRILHGIFILLLSFTTCAQIEQRVILDKSLHAGKVLLSDIDLDGDLDMISMGTPDMVLFDGLVITKFSGDMVPSSQHIEIIVDDFLIGNINSDQFPDIALRYQLYTSPTMYYGYMLNNGNGTFGNPAAIAEFDGNGAPVLTAIGNINGDPYPDLYIQKLSAPQHFYFQGLPNGFNPSPVQIGTERQQTLKDLNGDGLLDRIYATGDLDNVIESGELLKFGINNGSGQFIDSPSQLNALNIGASGNWIIQANDIDGDVMPEIMIGSNNRVVLRSDAGELNFTVFSSHVYSYTTDHLFGLDMNGNGSPDRMSQAPLNGINVGSATRYEFINFQIYDDVLTTISPQSGNVTIDGNTGFVQQELLPDIRAVGDLNGDSIPDMVIGNQGLGYMLGTGNGEFEQVEWVINAPALPQNGLGRLIQLDENGLSDWIGFGEAELFHAVLNENGISGVQVTPTFDSLPDLNEHLILQFTFAEVTGDEEDELVLFTTSNEENVDVWIYTHVGATAFEFYEFQPAVITEINQFNLGVYNNLEILLTDIDNDGDNDISMFMLPAGYNNTGTMFILKNNGGNFVNEQILLNLSMNFNGGPRWIDLTGDNFPELIHNPVNTSLRIGLNVNGVINDPGQISVMESVSVFFPISLNGDSLMDLLVHSYNQPVRKYSNLGSLNFLSEAIGSATTSLNGVIDINNNGEPDLLTNGLTWINQGQGQFESSAIDMIPWTGYTNAIASAMYGDYNFLPDLFFGSIYRYEYFPNTSENLTPPLECPSDLDGDGITTVTDLYQFIQSLPCSGFCLSDLNLDFLANVEDVIIFLQNFGISCE